MSPTRWASRQQLRRRLSTVAKLWVGVVVVLLATLRMPSWLLVTLSVVVAATIVWLVSDVGAWVDTARWWTPSPRFRRARGQDGRLARLEQYVNELDDPHVGEGCRRALSTVLVRALDDEVAATHGVLRVDDPARYASIVGPELSAFVEDADSGSASLTRRSLAEALAGIERL